ncbi:MAG TPA: Gfo/Idh/MocA family oxidoreductase, partial [Methylomirabilota bacterium]|nr:Gfo/Idh/MocA family oxidoreductase [Methylomirabilota bacterium]
MPLDFDRRDFLKTTAAGGLGMALGVAPEPSQAPALAPALFTAPALETVRIGLVGVGHQGSSHVANFLGIEGVEVRAICDLVPAKVERMQRLVADAGRPEPRGYSRGPEDFRRMCQEEELDLVFTATPWEWHAPVCKAALLAGKHAATEVPLAVTLDECWELVETAERVRRHCVMMENCCYDRTEMMILHMVRRGLFGDLLHAECGYLHDLRELKLTDFYQARWRVKHSIRRNGDLYPTHGL